jgi:hypothetical protein
LVVTDFGADNSGLTDARPGIQAAVDSCNSTVGCSVYFPAGTYLLNTPPPMSTAVITIPAGVPVTLEGVGQAGSVLQPITGSTGYDIISAAAGSSGFAMHDLGMNFTTVPVGGAAIRVGLDPV